MFGTVARMQVKPGKLEELKALIDEDDARAVEGYVASVVYQSTADLDEFWLTVIFKDRKAYEANANDPSQDDLYRRLRALLDSDPEWHDGEVVYATKGAWSQG